MKNSRLKYTFQIILILLQLTSLSIPSSALVNTYYENKVTTLTGMKINTSIAEIEVNQNTSISFIIEVINETTGERINFQSTPLLTLAIRKNDSLTISYYFNAKIVEIPNVGWNVSSKNLLDYKPGKYFLDIVIRIDRSKLMKELPMVITPIDNVLPSITFLNLEVNKTYSQSYKMKAKIKEDIQLLSVEVLKNNELYVSWDLYGVITSNTSNAFLSNKTFIIHSLELGSTENHFTEITIRAMDYSYTWIEKSIMIVLDSKGPTIDITSPTNLITTEYVPQPHIEIKEDEELVITWEASDEISELGNFTIEIDGEKITSTNELQIDLSGTLKPRYYAYSILITPYDIWGNRGSPAQISVFVLTKDGEIAELPFEDGETDSINFIRIFELLSYIVLLSISLKVVFLRKKDKNP